MSTIQNKNLHTTQIAEGSWPNVGPTTTSSLGQQRVPTLAPPHFAHRRNVEPTVGSPLAQRRLTARIALGQHWANRWLHVGPTLVAYMQPTVGSLLAQQRFTTLVFTYRGWFLMMHPACANVLLYSMCRQWAYAGQTYDVKNNKYLKCWHPLLCTSI